MKQSENLNLYIAEFIGTFFLLFAGCGAIVINNTYNNILGHCGIALSFGLIVMAMIYSVGNISGAHLNPAVTLGFFFAGRIDGKSVPFYIISQLAGAFAAVLILKIIFPDSQDYGTTVPTVDLPFAFLTEVIISFLLMFVILNVSTDHMEKGIMAGVAVGGIITLCALFAGPVTGASMNPARSLAPAIFSLRLNEIWIYLTAPVLGAFLASPMCRIIQKDQCCSTAKGDYNE